MVHDPKAVDADPSLAKEVWVIDDAPSTTCIERLGDARRLADAIGTRIGVLLLGELAGCGQQLIQQGADLVLTTDQSAAIATKVRTTLDAWQNERPKVVLAGGDPRSREWAALLAAELDGRLICPALMVEWRNEQLAVTRLDSTGRRSCRIIADDDRTMFVSFRPGVAEACAADPARTGEVRKINLSPAEEAVTQSQIIPANPSEVDIRHANRLVAGGRGLGSKQGFDRLRQFAEKLGAGVAASRMAVDLGWAPYERQVGQTGKTVAPDLYIACGISGASHHVQGMSQASHIIAINTDPNAPILKVAHLGLAADLNGVLENAERRLED